MCVPSTLLVPFCIGYSSIYNCTQCLNGYNISFTANSTYSVCAISDPNCSVYNSQANICSLCNNQTVIEGNLCV